MSARIRPLSDEEQYMCDFLGLSDDEVLDVNATRPRALIVGQAPGPHTRDDCAMFPYPENSAGYRLYTLSGQPTVYDYLRTYDRVNLMHEHGRWSSREAQVSARGLLRRVPEGVRLVLCGARVRDAFRPGTPWFTPVRVGAHPSLSGRWAIAIPHPSGRNYMLNDSAVRHQVVRAMLWADGEELT